MFLLINKSNSCIFARAILGSMKKEQHWSTLLDCPQSFLLSSCISLAQIQDSCCFLVTCIVTGPNWNIFQQNITSDLTRLCWGGYWETPVLTSLTWIQPYIGKMKGMSQGNKPTNHTEKGTTGSAARVWSRDWTMEQKLHFWSSESQLQVRRLFALPKIQQHTGNIRQHEKWKL